MKFNILTIFPEIFKIFEYGVISKAINNNLKPQVSINDGLHAVAIGEAAEKSIKENRVVKMSEFNL